jgi:hypothetical protein
MDREWIYRSLIAVLTFITVLLVVVILFPVVVYAETAGGVTAPDLSGFWAAIGERHWPLAVGIGLTALVWAARAFVVRKIPKAYLPWVTLALAIVGTAGMRMSQSISDGVPWWQGMIQGVLEGTTVGFAAIGYWDAKQTVKKTELK